MFLIESPSAHYPRAADLNTLQSMNLFLNAVRETEPLLDESRLSAHRNRWGNLDLGPQYRLMELDSDALMANHEGFDDRYHNFEEICAENGFGYKRYSVTTEDGYILSLDRIPPYGKQVGDDFVAPVVLL